MDWKRGRKLYTMLVVALILVMLCVASSFIVSSHVNNVITNLPGYTATTGGVRINILQAGYQIDSLKIFKIGGHNRIPLLEVPVVYLSPDWKSVLRGVPASRIIFEYPEINFISDKTYKQAGEEINWARVLKQLFPLNINHLSVKEGRLNFYDLKHRPGIKLFFHHVQLEANDLVNSKRGTGNFPARIFLRAHSIGNGLLSVVMKINTIKPIPDFDLDLKLENVNMRSLKTVLATYSKIDIEKGNFNLYSKVTVNDCTLKGYVKPIFDNLKFAAERKSDKPSRLNYISTSKASFPLIFKKSSGGKKFTSNVPLKAKIRNPHASFWPELWYFFRASLVNACGIAQMRTARQESETPDIRKKNITAANP